jgi:hypothetical protein
MKRVVPAIASSIPDKRYHLVTTAESDSRRPGTRPSQTKGLALKKDAPKSATFITNRMIILQINPQQHQWNHNDVKGQGGGGSTPRKNRNRGKTATILALAVTIILSATSVWSRAAAPQHQSAGQQTPQQGSMPDSMPNMPGMDMGNGANGQDADAKKDDRTAADAMHSMQPGHMMGPHMRMTPPRPATPQDWARADEIASALRASIERYKDYRVALADGYRIFAPNVRQSQYHFTNYYNGFLEGFTFDPARPTSLLYKKNKDGGYELVGAMYTAPKTASLDQLNERVPLGVASWHAHTNLCLPKPGTGGKADWTRFGLEGSISTLKECREAGGLFFPQVFGWMVHVYPFEPSREKVWGQDMEEKKLDHVPAP